MMPNHPTDVWVFAQITSVFILGVTVIVWLITRKTTYQYYSWVILAGGLLGTALLTWLIVGFAPGIV